MKKMPRKMLSMLKVVSNSSPIIHLAKIGKLWLLKDFFGTVVVPGAVYKECVVEGKERAEVALMRNADWLKVLQVNDKKLVRLLQSSIDNGESEAITLALEVGADLILLDDSDAREKARLYGLEITGTIGILLRAEKEGILSSIKETLEELKITGFWIGDELMSRLLK